MGQTNPPEAQGALATPASLACGDTRAEVNLDAIAGNVEALLRRVQGRALMAVVKANAYGHGAVEVAKTSIRQGASWIGVYGVEEGLVLRLAGITAPILVFGPFTAQQAAVVVDSGLTPTVTNLESARALQQESGGRLINVHLKIDTGLSRAGIAPPEARTLLDHISDLPNLRTQGLFSHFAAADEPDKSLTLDQLRLFHQTSARLADAGFHFELKHIANSAAILDLPETHLDLVRAGISLFGYYPSPHVSRDVPLHPALSLVSRVTRVYHVPAGTGVGYGHEFVCRRNTMLALAPIGYGDGISRTLGNGRGSVLVRGTRCPIVGRVSMDQITIDATGVPDVIPGDNVVLIGHSGNHRQTAEDLAEAEGTISYDVLTGLLPRVPRVYLENGVPTRVMSLLSSPRVTPAASEIPNDGRR